MIDAQPYVTDDELGETFRLMLGDSCERLAEVEVDSVDFSIYSPPFASLYVYSPSERDLGNSADQAQFLEHYRFIVDHLFRATKPGRLVAVHCAQVANFKWRDGVGGISDFRGDLIRVHQEAGFILHGECTVEKDPQFQATRTKSSALLFVSMEADGTRVRPALADYVLLFKVPGENAVKVKPQCSREEWIEWAHPIWHPDPENPDDDAILASAGLQRCWYGIRETHTLNTTVAKDNRDERHICPLQLDLIERCVRLWSNEGETVLSPFAGIGSEGVGALRLGRRFVGVELKPSYYKVAVENLRRVEAERSAPGLFDEVAS